MALPQPPPPGDGGVVPPGGSSAAAPRAKRPWVRPALEDFGSTRKLVRGATGPLGDPGTSIGKRPN